MAEKAISVRHAIVTDGSRPIKGLLSGPCVGGRSLFTGGGRRGGVVVVEPTDYFCPRAGGGTAERNDLNMLCASSSRGWRAKQPAEQTTSSKRG